MCICYVYVLYNVRITNDVLVKISALSRETLVRPTFARKPKREQSESDWKHFTLLTFSHVTAVDCFSVFSCSLHTQFIITTQLRCCRAGPTVPVRILTRNSREVSASVTVDRPVDSWMWTSGLLNPNIGVTGVGGSGRELLSRIWSIFCVCLLKPRNLGLNKNVIQKSIAILKTRNWKGWHCQPEKWWYRPKLFLEWVYTAIKKCQSNTECSCG